jgi:LPS export ABC transporter protein LptC
VTRRSTRSLAWTLVALGGWLVAQAGCGQTEPESIPHPPDLPVQVTYNYRTTQTHGGIPEWELQGATAERYPGRKSLHLTDVHMVFYHDGEKSADLTAESGEVEDETKNTVARGNVVVVNSEGKRLSSDILYWDNARELIHTDQFFRFEDGDQVLTGIGLETDPDLSDLHVLKSVEGEITPEDGGGGP